MKTITTIASAFLVGLAACGGGGDSACPPDQDYFVEKVWTPILSVSCIACHNPDGAARDTRFVMRTPDQPDFLADNLRIVSDVARLQEGGTSVLLLRPSGRHPLGHAGGTVVAFGGAQYAALEEFVGRVVGDEAACAAADGTCEAGAPGPQQLRRLTRDEFDNTIRDLFGFPSEWGAAFTADTVVNGYDNNARELTVSPLLADQVRKAAEEIAAQAMSDISSLLPCAPGNGRACAGEFVASFGERVFRRPVSSDQVARYLQVYDVGAEDGFEAGVELLIAAMLQSPGFLYRSEIGEHVGGGIYELTPYEIASELSYMLWRSMPDDDLFAAARSGALRDPAEIEAQALRMLASPKSRGALDRFTEQWLGIDQIGVVPKDSGVFPDFSSEIRTAMGEEAARLVADVTRSGGTLTDLLAAQYSIMNGPLAAFYGVSAPTNPDPAGFGRVDLDGERGGLLTLGAVLATHARPNDSSPVHRGKVVRERLLCQHLPPPPPGINAEPPGLDPSLTTRERYRQHSEDPACAGCHKLMDPIGFGFERFDGIGRFRADENGRDIDDAGEIVHPAGGGDTFQGVSGLSRLLAESPEAQACFALQWFRFAYGVEESPALRCVVDEVEAAFLAGDQGLQDLIVGLTRTAHFTRRVGPNPGDPGQDGPDAGPDTPDAGAGDSGGGSDDVTVSVVTDSEWPTGSCHSATVTNTSDRDVDWEVELAVDGTLNDYWNANATQSGNQVTFSGVEWNDVIGPGGSASFGFCVQQ